MHSLLEKDSASRSNQNRKNHQVVLKQVKNTKGTAPTTMMKPLNVTTTHQPVPTEAAPKKGSTKGKEEKVSTFT